MKAEELVEGLKIKDIVEAVKSSEIVEKQTRIDSLVNLDVSGLLFGIDGGKFLLDPGKQVAKKKHLRSCKIDLTIPPINSPTQANITFILPFHILFGWGYNGLEINTDSFCIGEYVGGSVRLKTDLKLDEIEDKTIKELYDFARGSNWF